MFLLVYFKQLYESKNKIMNRMRKNAFLYDKHLKLKLYL